jgi:hypothetical protein
MNKRLRVVGFALAGTLLLALPVSHLLWGAPPAGNKRLICHIDEETPGATGKVLEISIHAIPAHCKNHAGDYINLPATAKQGDDCPALPANAIRVCPTT